MAAADMKLLDRDSVVRLVEASGDLLLVSDLDGTIRELSAGWQCVLGWTDQDMIGRRGHEFMHPDDVAMTQNAAKSLKQRGSVLRFTNRYRTKWGDWRLLEWRAVVDLHNALIYATARDVTKDHSRQRQLERLGEVARVTTNSVVICDRDGCIEWVNEAFEQLTEWRLEEVIGLRPGQFLQFEKTDSDTVARMSRALKACEPVEAEILNRSRYGTEYWLKLEIQPRFNEAADHTGFVAVQTEITELVTARESAAAAEIRALEERERLIDAVEALTDGFVYYGPDNRLVLANTRYRELYALSEPAMAEGARIEDILKYGLERGQYADAIGQEEAWLKERLAALATKSQTLQRLSDGTVLQVIDRPMSDGGWVGLRVDVTELHDARLRAEAANRAKSEFLANMSHEIRTPLNGLLGMTELLAESSLDESQTDMLGAIRSAGWGLLSLLNDILDLARVEAGKVELEQRPFDLTELISQLGAVHGAATHVKGIAFDMVQEPGALPLRIGDTTRIMQILHNLIGNAIKFTEAGSVTVAVDASDTGAMVFRISDTGIGMSPEQLARVVNPFEQAEAGTARRFGGAGLGLAIVNRLVDLMGGHLRIDSAEGHGTTVELRLPAPAARQAAETMQLGAEGAGRDAEQEDRLRGLRLLVADDNATNRMILSSMLTKLGVDARFATNGAEACDLWRAEPFELVLLDISMPVMDGLEALRIMRDEAAISGQPGPRAIAATANVMTEQVAHYARCGFVGTLPKPFRKHQLVEVLCRALTT